MKKNLNILIATGIYPPATSGPAQYAKNMKDEWERMGHRVAVKTYTIEHKLPKIISHAYYFFKIIPSVIWSDFIFALDTSAVGFPAVVASKIFFKKIIMRTGGDRLWEEYVERTGDPVLLKNFYFESKGKKSSKEEFLFKVTRWTVRNVDLLVFSTLWQKNIWMDPYGLSAVPIRIIENRYGAKEPSTAPAALNFIAGARPLKWKNIPMLENIFSSDEIKKTGAFLDKENLGYGKFMEKMADSYAVILTSLGDISPHMILDAIRLNKPFILTEENGLMDRIGSMAVTVDPKDPQEIKEKILWLLNKENYDAQVEKIKNFTFTHTWGQIAQEVLDLFYTLK